MCLFWRRGQGRKAWNQMSEKKATSPHFSHVSRTVFTRERAYQTRLLAPKLSIKKRGVSNASLSLYQWNLNTSKTRVNFWVLLVRGCDLHTSGYDAFRILLTLSPQVVLITERNQQLCSECHTGPDVSTQITALTPVHSPRFRQSVTLVINAARDISEAVSPFRK